MRKLAILGVIILIVAVVLITMAVFDVAGMRATTYNAINGTVLMPLHNWIVSTWVTIGTLGFTYIAATALGLMIGGGLFMVLIVYGLFWQKLIQQKLLKKDQQAPTGTGSMRGAPVYETPVPISQNAPIPPEKEKPVEAT